MFINRVFRSVAALALVVGLLFSTGCTSSTASESSLTGDKNVVHERHNEGICSHVSDC